MFCSLNPIVSSLDHSQWRTSRLDTERDLIGPITKICQVSVVEIQRYNLWLTIRSRVGSFHLEVSRFLRHLQFSKQYAVNHRARGLCNHQSVELMFGLVALLGTLVV